MKRKNSVEKHKKERKQEENEGASTPTQEVPVEPEAQPAPEVEEPADDQPSSFSIGPLSLIAAARSSILRLLAGIRTEARERTEENEQDAAERGDTEQTINLANMREASQRLYNMRVIPFEPFRAIANAMQQGRELNEIDEEVNLTEIDLFFESPNISSFEQNPNPITNIILTITYYINDSPLRPKTVSPEDLEKDVPEVEASGEEGECSICLLNIEEKEVIRKLLCKHIFHSSCVSEWLTKYSNECPMCRKEAVVKTADEPSK
ncbi:hypothetical protein NEMIN01_0179 [Nematocida minor]|uniref:uncharacterized protein n=1 Tax=Nematocida minor TaxID=1912983 RepID=UPI00221FA210|nr:uncharacterized protein NEMIN01_0075 [Nematocida minor]XP_051332081.1 uncharacterized protein NEMIN01_0179 [Nematocida minor]KAI5188811.1 hypothetical protein NEMIN01_0075 [Nematocida minor]KAI5188915.1 hypothetical protein NEMIN01_0179 [Nematocida minor]